MQQRVLKLFLSNFKEICNKNVSNASAAAITNAFAFSPVCMAVCVCVFCGEYATTEAKSGKLSAWRVERVSDGGTLVCMELQYLLLCVIVAFILCHRIRQLVLCN